MVANRAVVIGGTGFLGRAVVTALDDAGFAVTATARTPQPGVRAVDGTDVAGTAALLAELRPDVVVNAAGALWGVDEQQMATSNALLPRRLLAALHLQEGPPFLVHIGSTYEYAAPDDGGPIDECTATVPSAAYGRSKLAGSDAVLSSTLPAAVLRASTVTGAGAPPGSLLAKIAAALRAREGTVPSPVLELPPLAGIRDFLDVRDFAAAVLAACRTRAAGVFNIASGVPESVPAVVDRLIELSGVRVRTSTDAARTGPTRDRGIGDQRIDNRRAAAVLGWSPRYGTDAMLAALWSGTSEARTSLSTSSR